MNLFQDKVATMKNSGSSQQLATTTVSNMIGNQMRSKDQPVAIKSIMKTNKPPLPGLCKNL